jgi:hypothetical protein
MMNNTADRLTGVLRSSIVTGALFLAAPAIALACTVCDSETGQQVRAGIVGAEFWSAALGVILPFAVTLVAVGVILSALFRGSHRGAPKIDRSFAS